MFTYYKTYKELGKKINEFEYEYVDLGLPSGTLWATCNVGASKPSDAGLYFQWGDTQGYTKDQVGKDKQFSWSDYKWSIDGSDTNFSKYKTTGATLGLEDDAANANMGGDWHMPSPYQIQELIDNTTITWTTQDGINGKLFTSKKDTSKSIFIPAAGNAWGDSLNNSGNWGYVWSSVLSTYNVSYGQYLYFFSAPEGLSSHGTTRNEGMPVRGVIGSGPLEGTVNGYPYVDLGLPNGTKWATCNVGASKPSDAGLYFQWGDTVGYAKDQVGKDKNFSWSDYKWGTSSNFTEYTTTSIPLKWEDDAANANMGGDWRMPRPDDISELLDNTTNTWTAQDGVYGRLFTSKKDDSKSIFIPAAGIARDGSLDYSGDDGHVWSSLLSTYNVSYGQDLSFSLDGVHLDDDLRYYGLSVRGVC